MAELLDELVMKFSFLSESGGIKRVTVFIGLALSLWLGFIIDVSASSACRYRRRLGDSGRVISSYYWFRVGLGLGIWLEVVVVIVIVMLVVFIVDDNVLCPLARPWSAGVASVRILLQWSFSDVISRRRGRICCPLLVLFTCAWS